MEKLKKIPNVLWIVIEFFAFVIRDLYSTIAYAYTAETAAEFNATYSELGFDINVAPITLTIFDCIVYALLSVLIFEFIVSIFYALLLRKGIMQIRREEFKFYLRIYYVIAAFIIGVLSMIYFAVPEQYVLYVSGAIAFTINAVALILCAYFHSKDWFAVKRRSKGYLQCWTLYFVVCAIVYIGSMVALFLIGTPAAEIIPEIILAINVLIVAPFGLLPYFRLKQLDELTVVSPSDNGRQQEEEEIFRDLGL